LGQFGGISRNQIPWYPTIDFDKCVGCQECFNFCHNGVFEWDSENNKPKIINPYNCVVGCSSCAKLCASEAITFPTLQDLRSAIEKARKGR